jgi:hypothetical protein
MISGEINAWYKSKSRRNETRLTNGISKKLNNVSKIQDRLLSKTEGVLKSENLNGRYDIVLYDSPSSDMTKLADMPLDEKKSNTGAKSSAEMLPPAKRTSDVQDPAHGKFIRKLRSHFRPKPPPPDAIPKVEPASMKQNLIKSPPFAAMTSAEPVNFGSLRPLNKTDRADIRPPAVAVLEFGEDNDPWWRKFDQCTQYVDEILKTQDRGRHVLVAVVTYDCKSDKSTFKFKIATYLCWRSAGGSDRTCLLWRKCDEGLETFAKHLSTVAAIALCVQKWYAEGDLTKLEADEVYKVLGPNCCKVASKVCLKYGVLCLPYFRLAVSSNSLQCFAPNVCSRKTSKTFTCIKVKKLRATSMSYSDATILVYAKRIACLTCTG